MQKFSGIIGGIIFIIWLVNFDADEYLRNNSPEIINGNSQEEISIPNESPAIKPIETSGYIFPLKDKSKKDIISFYGDPRGKKRLHQGIDIPEERGTPILAVADGKIVKAANKGNVGKQIWLEVDDKTFFYAHLDSILVEEDQQVKQGEIIGTVGNSGNAKHTLPHLHFGIYVGKKTIDPISFF